MVLRKWLFFFSVLSFLPVEGSEASFSRGRGSASDGFQSSVVSVLSPVNFTEGGQGILDQSAPFGVMSEFKEGAAFSYKVVENGFSSSERSVMDLCPECISRDKTARDIRNLSIAACEQVIKGEQCRGVEPKYLRNCEQEEESGLAFGQRVLGCLKGGGLEGAIGLGAGLVLGKVILGIGALLSLPILGPALGIAAGGGAALYIYSEYDRAYQDVGEGDGRAWRAMRKLLGEVGTAAYRLFLGNYECYSSEGRAWEVCGLITGGALGGKMALRAVKKSGKKEAFEAGEKEVFEEGASVPKRVFRRLNDSDVEIIEKAIGSKMTPAQREIIDQLYHRTRTELRFNTFNTRDIQELLQGGWSLQQLKKVGDTGIFRSIDSMKFKEVIKTYERLYD